MNKIIALLLFAVITIMLPYRALAAGLCCQLSSGIQESLLGVASPEPDKLSFQLTYSFTLMDKIKEGSGSRSVEDVTNAGKYTLIPITMDMTKYTLITAYSYSNEFTVFASIPYVRNTMDMTHMHMDGDWESHTMDPVSGVGDVTLMGIYRPYTKSANGTTDTLSLGLGVKTPTGSSTVKPSSGSYIHAHMQPGTGSWDPLFLLVYSKAIEPFLLQADLTYQLTTRNKNGYEFGDSFTANLSGRYAAASVFNFTGGLTYLHLNKAKDRDGKYTNLMSLMDDPANTGGDSIWFSPGIQLLPLKNSLVDFKVQFPVWERVNGTQLVSSYRVLLGITYGF